jgi:hypothetical protein
MSRRARRFVAFVTCIALGGGIASAQDASDTAPAAAASDVRDAKTTAEPPWRPPHRFWDAGNIALAGGVAASRALDYHSTGHFRELGNHEWLLTNRIVDNKPLFAAIEVGGAAATIGVAYWLHRNGHHKMERWLMVIHTGITTGGAIHNYSLDPPK